ncbi:MAG: efflux RND transporter periplasmic adaptor subunit [Gammaproteobacteria bacterium]|nr:efflux RND transporter periplasmic adaptor subunit [Gammaproteobacteria bacterium]
MRLIQLCAALLSLNHPFLSAATLPIITPDQQQALGIHTTPPVADDVAIRTTAIGVVQQAPNSRWTVAKPYALQVKQLHVKVGDSVKQGQVLAEIFVPELQKLEHLYHNALSSAHLAQQKIQREAQLLKEGIIAPKQYEVTQTEYQQAQENALAIFTQIARMELTESELALLKDPKNRHLEGHITLNAPADGKIQQIALTVGDSFDANQTLMNLLTSDALTLEVALTLDQLGQLQIGDKLRLVDGSTAKIINIQNRLSDAQKVIVTANFQHPNLRAGQRVYVQVSQNSITELPNWRLPRQAIVYVNNLPHIFVLAEQQLSAMRVELVRATREGWVVKANELSAKSAVIISGTAAAKAIYTESVAP